MRVGHGCLDIGMAHQFLDDRDGNTLGHQLCAESMAQEMRVNPFDGPATISEKSSQCLGIHGLTSSFALEEDEARIMGTFFGAFVIEINLERSLHEWRDGEYSFTPSLSADADGAVDEIDVVQFDAQDLEGSEAAEDHEEDDGAIAIPFYTAEEYLNLPAGQRSNNINRDLDFPGAPFVSLEPCFTEERRVALPPVENG